MESEVDKCTFKAQINICSMIFLSKGQDILVRYRQAEQAFSVRPHGFERGVNVTDTPTSRFS